MSIDGFLVRFRPDSLNTLQFAVHQANDKLDADIGRFTKFGVNTKFYVQHRRYAFQSGIPFARVTKFFTYSFMSKLNKNRVRVKINGINYLLISANIVNAYTIIKNVSYYEK
ncbi:hypothetical protein RF11_09646 [Thelohanellus kitauei]|uniref:Uncharacterized protein n=1 Tax=Thelohanellus kitauei TaxID=669202 RepID=A0A0C2JWC1_THEKT|nr:hypothetical protein RF11_09646 [Thelohanellus kitauei]